MSFYKSSLKDLKIIKTPSKEQPFLHINLNLPEKSNAISMEMIEGLEMILGHAKSDKAVRVVLISGEGKSFCAGGDIEAMKARTGMFDGDSPKLRMSYQEGIQRIPKLLESFTKPLIALVNGPAVGAGCDLACMCDLRVGSDKASFMESFAKLALIPGDGGTFFLSRIVGYAKAMELFLTSRKVDANEALNLGLLNKIATAESLYEEGYKLAGEIVKNAPIAIELTKRALKEARLSTLDSQLELLSTYQAITQRTYDHEEALRAFAEKRSPHFEGK